MIEHLFTLNTNLRTLCEEYTSPSIPYGINWLEIDTLVTALVVRFHPRVEVIRSPEGCEIMCHSVAGRRIHGYGVTHVDDSNNPLYLSQVAWTEHRPVKRKYARQSPVFRLGEWRTWTEVGATVGLLLYNSHNVEAPIACKARRESSGLDHLFRANAGRMAVEHWKRFQGLADELVYPPTDPRSRRLWQELAGEGKLNR
ncbi:hypothetical protein RUM44_007822 [Polyplax serrata]|uniref:Uncharacterized protein n=1 Tax=Polyplax serrata TaxID=468196 RepID=A0ABR1BAZ5_POLSC